MKRSVMSKSMARNLNMLCRGTGALLLFGLFLGLVGAADPLIAGKSPAEWTKILRDENVETRFDAMVALNKVGAEARPVLPALIAALRDEDLRVRVLAARTMGRIGPEAKSAAAPLTELLGSPESVVRSSATTALKQIGSSSIPPLVKSLAGSTPRIRRAAALALGTFGAEARSATVELVKALTDESFAVRRAAAQALAAIEPQEPSALTVLAERLTLDDDADVAHHMALALAKGGKPAVAVVLPLLRHTRAATRYHAVLVLREMKSAPVDAVKSVQVLLKDDDADVRAVALEAVGTLGETAIPILVGSLKDTSADIRRGAALGLARVGAPASEAVPALSAALADSEPTVRQAAAQALGEIGPAARAAVPELVQGLKDRTRGYRDPAILALVRIGKPAALPVAALLDEKDTETRLAALVALGFLGREAADEVVKPVTAALKDENREIRLQAVRALGRIGSGAKSAVPALKPLLSDDEPLIRRTTTDALRKIQGDDKEP
jgi:HEAT repeat protein